MRRGGVNVTALVKTNAEGKFLSIHGTSKVISFHFDFLCFAKCELRLLTIQREGCIHNN